MEKEELQESKRMARGISVDENRARAGLMTETTRFKFYQERRLEKL